MVEEDCSYGCKNVCVHPSSGCDLQPLCQVCGFCNYNLQHKILEQKNNATTKENMNKYKKVLAVALTTNNNNNNKKMTMFMSIKG